MMSLVFLNKVYLALLLIAQVESLSHQIEESNRRLRAVEAQMERGRGMGLGILLATVGLSAGGASVLTKWLN